MHHLFLYRDIIHQEIVRGRCDSQPDFAFCDATRPITITSGDVGGRMARTQAATLQCSQPLY